MAAAAAAEAAQLVPASMQVTHVQQLLDDLMQQRSTLPPDKDPALSQLDSTIIALMA